MNEDEADIQRALRDRGFDPGPIDGIRGPRTEAAIVDFKISKGLRARPLIGPITRNLLGLEPEPAPIYRNAWMIEAGRHMGLKEIPGKLHNPTILGWVRKNGGWFTDDETPWCGTFVAHCLRTAGHDIPKHWYRAKAYLDWGVECQPQAEALATFGRRGGGHVGFIVGENDTDLYILGGNQRNEVNISPISKRRLIGCRWPLSEPLGLPRLPRMAGGVRTTNEA